MIRMGSVRQGYVDDLKKAHADLNILAETDVKVPDSQARLVRSNWHEAGRVEDDVALLIIHAGQVYILDARTDEQHLPETRAAFDAIQSSLQWAK